MEGVCEIWLEEQGRTRKAAAQKKRTEKKERERSDRYNTVSCYFMYDSIFYTSLCRTEDSCTRRFYGYDSL